MKYLTLKEFAQQCHISENTIKLNIESIPGASIIDRKLMFLEGTRYPFSINRYSLDTYSKIIVIILKALNKMQYIDNQALKICETDFNDMLDALKDANMIDKRKCENQIASNAYKITLQGAEFLGRHKMKSLKQLAEIVGTMIGVATAVVLNS